MLNLDHYHYELPPELVAQQPLANRSDARLMVVDRNRQSIEHFHIRDLPEILSDNDHLVFNNTRVLPAKLVGYRQRTRGRWQGLFLEQEVENPVDEISADGPLTGQPLPAAAPTWRVLAKTRGKIEVGEQVTLQDRQGRDSLELTLVARLGGGQWAARPTALLTAGSGPHLPENWPSLADLLDRVGRVPLPHYIRDGQMVDQDQLDYQTVFASEPGAVAAPTAGLHFTQPLLDKLSAAGVSQSTVTLHVGMGTFRPIKTDDVRGHEMHEELIQLAEPAAVELRAARQSGKRLIAVGTTCMRTLETPDVFAAIETGSSWAGSTQLFIYPGFEFRVANALLTNFHLPRTSLLVLVRTFGGDALMRRAYQEAIEQRYRFYSYGDAMLIL